MGRKSRKRKAEGLEKHKLQKRAKKEEMKKKKKDRTSIKIQKKERKQVAALSYFQWDLCFPTAVNSFPKKKTRKQI